MTDISDETPAAAPVPVDTPMPTFTDLGLRADVLKAVAAVGYEAPSPIQIAAIPPLLEGRDLVGQAQTGTGKTAAFALPLLSRLERQGRPQVLVLTPTRELAIQVAEAIQTYARFVPGFQVLPVYGGQDIHTQLRHLKRGVDAIVGTPGRIRDHLERRTLDLSSLQAVVLDEADEMLRMGFLEEVEEILEQTPAEKQVALFSATLPEPIRKIARRYLRNPVEIHIKSLTTTVDTIRQRYWPVLGVNKLDALTRIFEAEEFDAMLVFVRTRGATTELAEKLSARGYACAALNGEMSQSAREKTVEKLRDGSLEIVVATDVAARGLDVDRISHVVNYDMPYDNEAYVHRIGRTGRAGRSGQAILFVTPRERDALRALERATRQPIERLRLPTLVDIQERRIAQFKEGLTKVLEEQDLEFLTELLEEIEYETEVPAARLAAALAFQLQKDRPLLPDLPSDLEPAFSQQRRPEAGAPRERGPWGDAGRRSDGRRDDNKRDSRGGGPVAMARYRLEVGHEHGVSPKNIVGAIANESGIGGKHIGRIEINDVFTLVDLPARLSEAERHSLGRLRICGQEVRLSEANRG